MKLYFRLLYLIFTQRLRARCSVLGPCDTSLRVWPNDLDVFFHVNNGVYMTLMDLGRTDMMLRSGVFGPVRAKGWYPVVAAETIRFQRSLRLFQQFNIRTEVVGWDEKSIYIEQVFSSNNKQVAIAALNIRFLAKTGGTVSPADLLGLLGEQHHDQPDLPEWINSWNIAIAAMPVQRD
ncbi:MAG: acyl-CoA thioesterase [Granulosicoccaceae bacterium]